MILNTEDIRYYWLALIIGTLGGVVGSVFHLSLDAIFHIYSGFLIRFDSEYTAAAIVGAAAISASMAVLAVYLVRRFAPEAAGSGVQEIEGAMEGKRDVHWLRALLVKFFGGLLALGSGLVLGREGPTIHMGATIAKGVYEKTAFSETDKRGLLAAGAGAGLAAAFNAPLAAVVFVIEEMQEQFPFRRNTYVALILAAIASTIATELLTGRNALLEIPVQAVPFSALPLIAVLGCVAGVLGVVFNWLLLRLLDFVHSLPKNLWWCPALVLGATSGALLVVFPEAIRGGEQFVLHLSATQLGIGMLALLAIVRFVGAALSYAAGTPGGIFAPMLAIAASVGMLLGALAYGFFPISDLGKVCAIVAMGAFFTASVRAPLVGTILVLELTNAYALLLPLIIGCACSTTVAQIFGGRPIYTLLLERTLRLAAAANSTQNCAKSKAFKQ